MEESHTHSSLLSARINYLSHLLFPARSVIKDIIFWATELAAGAIFLSFILRNKWEESNVYKQDDYVAGLEWKDDTDFVEPKPLAPVLGFKEFPSQFFQYEYGWICLCYSIKYFVYLIDTLILVKKKVCRGIDIVPPVLMTFIWVLWLIYAFTLSGYSIFAGVYTRYDIETAKNCKEAPLCKQGSPEGYWDNIIANENRFYDENEKWRWLWVPSMIVAFVLLCLFFYNLIQMRSSAFSNVALSTVLIPLQLFFFHLFLKGSWMDSNAEEHIERYVKGVPQKENSDKGEYLDYVFGLDMYEARWVFPVIYLGAWGGLACAVGCIVKAVSDRKVHLLNTIKNSFYALFFVVAFIWALVLDRILFERTISKPMKNFLTVIHIIGLAVGVLLAIASITQKIRWTGDYNKFHQEYHTWIKYNPSSAAVGIPAYKGDNTPVVEVANRP